MDPNTDLAILTRRLVAMCASGINLATMLDRLAVDIGEPYAGVLRQVRARVCDDGLTFHAALAEHTAHFPPTYIALVRVGEVAGMLDRALLDLADLLEEDLRLSRALGRPAGVLAAPACESLDSCAPAARAALLSLFCRTFGLLLSSGVPVLPAMEVSADILPAPQRDAWLAIREGVSQGRRIGAVPFLPAFANAMVATGLDAGTLDVALLHAADAFRYEVTARALGE